MSLSEQQSEKDEKDEEKRDRVVIPALNDFHPIHKVHVLFFGVELGHDHCSRRRVKLRGGRNESWYLVCAFY